MLRQLRPPAHPHEKLLLPHLHCVSTCCRRAPRSWAQRTRHKLAAIAPPPWELPGDLLGPTSDLPLPLPNSTLTSPLSHHSSTSTSTTSSPSSLSAVALAVEPSIDGAALAAWVAEQGGFVHPALLVVERTPASGCRGVVATSAISLQQLSETPLVAVPERLYMTSRHAQQLLRSVRPPPQPPLPGFLARLHKQQHQDQQLSPVLSLAVLLAHERSKGTSSFWHPYIQALPQQPPVAWLVPREELSAQLVAFGPLAAGWAEEVAAARAQKEKEAAWAVRQYGDVLPGVTQEGVIWALAQVMSRAFGGGQDVALAPLIDMCNHQLHAGTPSCWLDEDNDGEPIVFITSQREGQPLPLQPGQELFVSYLPERLAPLAAFLNFGFIPSELLPAGMQSAQNGAQRHAAALYN